MKKEQEYDAALIRAARSAQTAAIAQSDFATVVSFWTEDITVRRAHGQHVSGIPAALSALEPVGESQLVYQREAVEIEVSSCGARAYEQGVWSGHPRSARAAAVIGGRYAAQWVKQDGRWLIRAEIYVALSGNGKF